MLEQVARVLATVSVLAAEVSFAASNIANRVTITSVNMYSSFFNSPSAYYGGALFFFTPAIPKSLRGLCQPQ